MTTDRVGFTFGNLPTVKIGDQQIDVRDKRNFTEKVTIDGKQYDAIKMGQGTFMVAAKRQGGGYQVDIVGNPKELAKWKFKVKNARIDRIGTAYDALVNKSNKAVSKTFQLDSGFVDRFRKNAESALGRQLRQAGLTDLQDRDIDTLRRNHKQPVQFISFLLTSKIPIEKRRAELKSALQPIGSKNAIADPNSIRELPQPPSNPDEVVDRVRKAGLKFDDSKFRVALQKRELESIDFDRLINRQFPQDARQEYLNDFIAGNPRQWQPKSPSSSPHGQLRGTGPKDSQAPIVSNLPDRKPGMVGNRDSVQLQAMHEVKKGAARIGKKLESLPDSNLGRKLDQLDKAFNEALRKPKFDANKWTPYFSELETAVDKELTQQVRKQNAIQASLYLDKKFKAGPLVDKAKLELNGKHRMENRRFTSNELAQVKDKIKQAFQQQQKVVTATQDAIALQVIKDFIRN